MTNDITLAKKIAKEVTSLGGSVYFVGGCVRDELLGKPSKDIDIEVHGISPKALESILDRLGERLEIGKSFGVYGLKGHTLDIAMPRKERAVGRGHRDFVVDVDPLIGTLAAAKRRDFTIGALMKEVLSGKLVDHFGGLDDLKNGVLRHVDPASFPEDPLRVLRGAQFAARFGFTIAPETVELCRSIDLAALPKERVMEELKKALLGAKRPSVFFEVLRQMEQLSPWFDELAALIAVPQNPKYHAEGDVWQHTLMVLDQAAALRDKAEHPLALMLAALAHDFGKKTTTQFIRGAYHAYGHEREGLPLVTAFLRRLTCERELCSHVLNLVSLHMQPCAAAGRGDKLSTTNRMFDRALSPRDLVLLALADDRGRISEAARDCEAFLEERLQAYHETMALPFVEGKDLLAAGLTPDRHFSELLAYAHKLRLSQTPKETALKQTLAHARAIQKKGRPS